jgi:hypothetical protein
VAARWPYIYFIDPEKTPEGALAAGDRIDIQEGDADDANANGGWFPRICLASYQKADNKRYLIAAWGNGRYREFLDVGRQTLQTKLVTFATPKNST